MRQIVHEIKLAGYGVTCDSLFYARGFLTIGADVGRILLPHTAETTAR